MLTSGPAGVKFCSCLSRSSGILGNRRREKDVASRPRSRDANLREREGNDKKGNRNGG